MARVKQMIKLIIILGTIAVALNLLFGNNTIQFVQKQQINGTWLTWYSYDIQGYVRNLETTITDTTDLQLILPTRTWIDTDASMITSEFWDALGNNLALILDYIIMAINILIYPLKVGGYVLGIVLSLFGIELTNESSDIYWLCNISQIFKALSIPYV